MNADGINYLDIGDAYMRGDLEAAVNSVWSPLYSWILGAVMAVVQPSMRWEFPVVHAVNFAIYLGALFGFEFAWRQLVLHRNQLNAINGDKGLPDWTLWSIGYLLFIVASLHLIELWAVTPDMLMSVFVYLAAGLIIKNRTHGTSAARQVLLGLVLGAGYLAKSIMFPMAFVFLAVAGLGTSTIRKAVVATLVATSVFVAVAAPFVYLLSQKKGEFTFGDAGKITYARYLNDLPYPHWQGGPDGRGEPLHPTRVVFEKPFIYEFSEPVGGTYPVSYDPWYWYEGVNIRVDVQRQIGYLAYSVWFYMTILLGGFGPITFGIVVLVLHFGFRHGPVYEVFRRWGISLIGLGGLALYSTIHVIGRYIGAFFILVFLDVLAHVRTGDTQNDRRTLNIVAITVITLMLAGIGVFNLEGALALSGNRDPHAGQSMTAPAPSELDVATMLSNMGVRRGDHVAIIGDGFTADWARLARVKIVAEMPVSESSLFWSADDNLRNSALQAFLRTGAAVVIAEDVPEYAPTNQWIRIGDSSSFIHLLKSSDNSEPPLDLAK